MGLVRARRATEMLTELTGELTTLDPESLEVVAGRFAVSDRVAELMRSAQSEVLTMVTSRPGPGAIQHARSTDSELLARGVLPDPGPGGAAARIARTGTAPAPAP